MKYVLLPLFLLPGLLVITRCHSDESRNLEFADLLHHAGRLEQRHCALKASIDSLWDVTSARLEQALPSDFPAVDRNIFLQARNADHIKMFMSFKKLDAPAQSLVNEAGKYDEVLADQMRDLLKQKEAFEQRKISFLKKVVQKDAVIGQTYATELRTAGSGKCR